MPLSQRERTVLPEERKINSPEISLKRVLASALQTTTTYSVQESRTRNVPASNEVGKNALAALPRHNRRNCSAPSHTVIAFDVEILKFTYFDAIAPLVAVILIFRTSVL